MRVLPSTARFAPIRAVCEATGKSKPTIYQWMKSGRFPRPVKLGPNSVGWRVSDVEAWAADPSKWEAHQEAVR